MSAVYCSNCGVKHEYSYSKPKFCSSCGFQMSVTLSSLPITRKSTKEEYYEDEGEDENSSNSLFVPKLRKIEVDVESYSENSSFSLGSLFGEPSKAPTERRQRTQSIDDFISNKSSSGNR